MALPVQSQNDTLRNKVTERPKFILSHCVSKKADKYLENKGSNVERILTHTNLGREYRTLGHSLSFFKTTPNTIE